MKILVLAPEVPATSRMPGSPRLFNLARELAKHHELMLLVRSGSEERYQAFLADPDSARVFSRVEVLPDPPPLRWMGQQWHRLHLAAHFETRFRHGHYYRGIRERIRRLCSRERFDLIYVDLLAMVQYVDTRMNIPSLVDLHDSMTLLCERTLRAERGWRRRLSAYVSLVSARRLEAALGASTDLIITNSAVDEGVIRSLANGTPRPPRTLTIPNGVDMEYFAPDTTAIEPDTIVFTGVMSYVPNEDAAVHFVEDIFPLVRAVRPHVTLTIVGSEPPARVRALADVPGVRVTGKVDDVRPFLRRAALFICPLRVGSGVKNKLLAAMAMQKAAVATSMSVDGLDLDDNREVLLADEPAAFADRVLRLLADPEEARRLGANGLAKVREQYSWSAMGDALEGAIETILAARSAAPA